MRFRRSFKSLAPSAPPESADGALLHVGLDVRVWEMSGLGTYVRELLAGAARLQLPIAWTLVGPERLREQMPEGLTIERWIDWDRPVYGLRSTLAYPKLGRLDVFHYPHYNLPLGVGPRCVTTVFDLFHLRYGSWFKQLYQRWFLRRLRWSRVRLITASEKTAAELRQIAGIAEKRIACIPLGMGHHRSAGPADPIAVQSLTGARIQAPWLLTVGIDQPHKNFDALISMLTLYYQRRPDAPSLVWTGMSPEDAQRRAKMIPASLRDRVGLEPYSNPQRLEALYAGAAALIFPSLDEGFGLPPLEAMARGVPVICTRREPMIAILGDAPLYFEPTDTPSLWRMIDRLIDVPSIRQEVVRRGIQQAARYPWDACVRKTYAIYQEAARRGRRARPAPNENAEAEEPPRTDSVDNEA